MSSELVTYEQKLKLIPNTVFTRFGCAGSCYARHTDKCHVKNEVYPEELICEERKAWLISLLPDYKREPSNAEVMLDVAKSLSHMRNMKEYEIMQDFEVRMKQTAKDIEKAERANDTETAKKLKKIYSMLETNFNRAFDRFHLLIKQSQNIEAERMRLDTPKHHIIERRVISPVDVAELIENAKRKSNEVERKPIDAEFKELIDEGRHGDK